MPSDLQSGTVGKRELQVVHSFHRTVVPRRNSQMGSRPRDWLLFH